MINEFRGKYYFLSNFSDSKIVVNGITFLNGEAAFHSFKDLTKQADFANLDPSSAKRKGRSVQLRHDWEKVKDDIMYQVIKSKFEQNEDLRLKLLATEDHELIEGNTWNDTYWGVCRGRGKNMLGKTLMRVRNEFRGK